MRSNALLAVGLAAGSLWGLGRRRRRSAERLAAATFETLLNAIEANDRETGRHVRRVARYSMILADAMDMNNHEVRAVERIALFHDIGKIYEALFDVIHDNTTLSPAEWRAIATHPQRGADVLAPLTPFYPELPKGVVAHHERWDGSGYPRGLRGRRIPLYARLVAVTDTFDVIANGRHYRRAGGAAGAALEIARERGTQFDPEIVDLLLWPPVLELLAAAHLSSYVRRGTEGERREPAAHERNVPDVRFRWRSKFLASASASLRPRGIRVAAISHA